MSGFADLSRAALTARAERPTVPLALATLVEVEGSSYRRPGARLLVDAEGRVLAGAISGGCLEADVAAHAETVSATGTPRLLRYDLRDDLEAIWGFGSSCDGIATVLLEPLPDETWLAEAEARRRRREGGTVRVRYIADHIGPQATTAMHVGTTLIDDGRAGADAVAVGGVRIIDEPLVSPIALYLVGAGRGAEAFARIAGTLQWHTTVIDHREALLDAIALPHGTTKLLGDAETIVAQLRWDARVAVALLTHIYDTDYAWTRAVLERAHGYIGILGSRQRAARLMDRLQDDGVTITDETRLRMHAPIGLDLGGETPESIALAAIAEIEAVMHGRSGGLLRDRRTPIHERGIAPCTTGGGVRE